MPNDQKEWMTPELVEQVRVSKRLGVAFALSIAGIAGIGSLIAFILGLKALRAIRQSGGKLGGRLMAWWCIVVGGLGTITLPALTLKLILDQLK